MNLILKDTIKKFVPPPVISGVKYVVFLLRDGVDLLFRNKDPLVPPTRLMFDVPLGQRNILSFKRDGEEFFGYFIHLCNPKADETILDVGCGIGRKTVPLTKFLNTEGRYEGFDIVKKGINWCKLNISTKYPNFYFQLIDVYNEHYNPKAKIKSSEFTFPYANESFDCVLLGSVFTHMLPEDMENYLFEISRVLKEGGKCLISFFLLNAEALEMIERGKSTLNFKYQIGNHRTVNPKVPEDAVCYDESFILTLYSKCGLSIKGPIHYGSWCNRDNYLSYQDIIFAKKVKPVK
jgi:SAM-dependent methyltransferase